MHITDISRTKRGRFSIYVDGEFTCALHPDILAASGLGIGDEVESCRLEELYRGSQERITRERAMSLLARQAYTARGLYDKLAAYADEESAAAAVERMQELGLIDDADYARRYALDCLNLKHYSHSRTARALLEKGIDRETVEATLAEMEEDAEASIAAVVRRRYLRALQGGGEKEERRAVNGLLRLGYRYGDIRRVLNNLAEDEEYYSEEE